MQNTIRSVCQGCHCQCGVIVHVENGKVTGITGDPDHPMNHGFICVKGRAQADILYHPDRLKYPLRRSGAKGQGKWERISWDGALNYMAENLDRIQSKGGPESIAVITGTGPRTGNNYANLFAYLFGTPNKISVDCHICFAPSVVAETNTYGEVTTMMEIGPDYRNASCILVWGANPLASHPPRGEEIVEAKRKRGAKLIVVDPRRTTLAAMADKWLQVRPGTDVALALGMLNVIINEGLYDKEFVSRWCYGFAELAEHVQAFSPEKAAAITWIPADEIKAAARLYAGTKPAVLHHRIGVEHNINSTQSNRAFAILIALTGNLDVKGGNLCQFLPQGFTNMGKQFKLDRDIKIKCVGGKEYPLTSGPDNPGPFVQSPLAAEAMVEGNPYPIKALYCTAGNPVVNMQNSKRVWRALQGLEFLGVADFFMTPTAELADIVLPASTWLEKDDLGDFPNLMYTNYLAAGQKAVEPLGECWDDRKILIELGKRVHWKGSRNLPWSDVQALNEDSIKSLGISFQTLQEKKYLVEPMQYKKYLNRGFKTPTGKVELYSTVFRDRGYDPLPTYHEPPESPVSTPGLINEYPLILISGGRNIAYFNTEGRQIGRLRKLVPDPVIEVHPETAKAAGIAEGDWIWLETPQVRGERVRFRASFVSDIHPGVVHVPHGWWYPEKPSPEHGCFDSNVNTVLTGDPPREPICGSVRTRGTLCRIYK
ncbi:MAG: acetylene hydratase-like molybdopterin oxidoreductase [Chloroflexi bacterium]|nr:acetylene hydratase-like molybdopterin oxidoreductase [Chloroflexota bacterium]